MSKQPNPSKKIATAVAKAEALIAEGLLTPKALKRAGISAPTFYRWRTLKRAAGKAKRAAAAGRRKGPEQELAALLASSPTRKQGLAAVVICSPSDLADTIKRLLAGGGLND